MNRSTSLRPAQSLTSAPTSTPARHLRAALLGSLALIGSVGTALAQDTPTVKAKQGDAQSLWLTVENPAQARMQLRVVSKVQHICLVNEVNHKFSYGSKLNFNGLPAGKYAVLLRVGNERYTYNVQVQSLPQTTISVPGLTPPNTPEVVASATR